MDMPCIDREKPEIRNVGCQVPACAECQLDGMRNGDCSLELGALDTASHSSHSIVCLAAPCQWVPGYVASATTLTHSSDDFKFGATSQVLENSSLSFFIAAMRRAPRYVTSSLPHRTAHELSSRHAHSFSNFRRAPMPSAPWNASSARRSLFLASNTPITISDDRNHITFSLKDGSDITRKISPTPKANLTKLADGLAVLLLTPEAHKAIDPTNPNETSDVGHISFGTREWELDAQGDAIHRHTAHASADDLQAVKTMIKSSAEKMNHDPHITEGSAKEGGANYMTITCTTHSPRGLSVRDTRLAREINQILEGFRHLEPVEIEPGQDLEAVRQRIATQQEQMIALNREKINEALGSCNCATK